MKFEGDRRRDAVKFLMGLGCNPSLTARDQRILRQYIRAGMTSAEARDVLAVIEGRKA
jgi:hypothetical protein